AGRESQHLHQPSCELIPGVVLLEKSGEVTTLAEAVGELRTGDLGETLDETELDQLQALDVDVEDSGIARLGETVGEIQQVSTSGTIRLDDSLGEMGTLFGQDGKGWASSGDGEGGASFFGVKAGGNRFAFVVDASSSMRRNGWPACQYELISAVKRLKPHQFFYVVLFNKTPHPMVIDGKPATKAVRATEHNVAELNKWVLSFELSTATLPKEAMRLALQTRPNAIYFLTDGRISDDTEAYLQKNNKRENAYEEADRMATVQTIGFYSEAGREVLQRIANDNGGKFRYVGRPGGDRPKRGNPRKRKR
ncbi:MAG: VWA domain-containing protein, partial [bacterium]|nr:VWA domain-containing protein [bacterium]